MLISKVGKRVHGNLGNRQDLNSVFNSLSILLTFYFHHQNAYSLLWDWVLSTVEAR